MLDQINKMIEKLDADKNKLHNAYTVRGILTGWKDVLEHWPNKAEMQRIMVQKGGNYLHAKKIVDTCTTKKKITSYIKSLIEFQYNEFKGYF